MPARCRDIGGARPSASGCFQPGLFGSFYFRAGCEVCGPGRVTGDFALHDSIAQGGCFEEQPKILQKMANEHLRLILVTSGNMRRDMAIRRA